MVTTDDSLRKCEKFHCLGSPLPGPGLPVCACVCACVLLCAGVHVCGVCMPGCACGLGYLDMGVQLGVGGPWVPTGQAGRQRQKTHGNCVWSTLEGFTEPLPHVHTVFSAGSEFPAPICVHTSQHCAPLVGVVGAETSALCTMSSNSEQLAGSLIHITSPKRPVGRQGWAPVKWACQQCPVP